MASARNPTVRRRELGVLLRTLRTERGWTVDYVAEQLECSPSKVSRMETGQRGAGARDVRDLADLYEVDDKQRERMVMLASEGKQRASWLPQNLPYSRYIALEADATVISDYGLNVMPGLLQTPEYARATVRAVAPYYAPDVVEQRVIGRVARQQILAADNAPQFEAVIDESVLHRVVESPAVMAAQLSRLLEVSELPNVGLRVIPYDAGALPAVNNKFIVLHFSAIPNVVFVEGLTADQYLDNPQDVDVYVRAFSALRNLAATPDETREIIDRKIAAFRSRGR